MIRFVCWLLSVEVLKSNSMSDLFRAREIRKSLSSDRDVTFDDLAGAVDEALAGWKERIWSTKGSTRQKSESLIPARRTVRLAQ